MLAKTGAVQYFQAEAKDQSCLEIILMQMLKSQPYNLSNWYGAVLMGIAAALFPVKDAFIKVLTGSISALEAGLIYFAVQVIVAFFWFRIRKMQDAKLFPPIKLSLLLVLRSLFQILAIILFFHSIQHAPLAEAVVLFSSNALFVILFSFLFLRVNTKIDVIVTAFFGFIGVIIVLGPSIWNFGNIHLLFALFSAISFAVYLILTEKVGEKYPANQMLIVDGVLGVLLILICVIVFIGLDASSSTFYNLSGQGWFYLLASGSIGTCSALLVISAMKFAPAPLIAPLGYIEIVSAAIIGILIFDERVYTSSVIGCFFILISSWRCGWLASKSET